MNRFKLIVEEIEYHIERIDVEEIFKVSSKLGTHTILRDKAGKWNFHEHLVGSTPIPLIEIGQEIEKYYK